MTKARKALLAAGVKVRDSSAAFALTHQKSMVIDDKIGFVESLNWEPRDLTETRDYAVATTKKSEVKEMIRCFDADWARKPFKPDPKSRTAFGAPITDANGSRPSSTRRRNRSGFKMNAIRIQSSSKARSRGEPWGSRPGSWRAPHIRCRERSSLKASAGCELCTTSGPRFTFKALEIARQDGDRGRQASDSRIDQSQPRQFRLTARTRDRNYVEPVLKRLVQVSRRDWKHSRKLDLSDEGLLADFEKHGAKGADKLAIPTHSSGRTAE